MLLCEREAGNLAELAAVVQRKTELLTQQRDRLEKYRLCLDSAVWRATVAATMPDTQLLLAYSDLAPSLATMSRYPLSNVPDTDASVEFSVELEQLKRLVGEAAVVDRSCCAARSTASGGGLEVAAVGRAASFVGLSGRVQHLLLLSTAKFS